MSEPLEATSGLLWMGARTAPWTCLADCHVYDVQIARLPIPPSERPTLHWLGFTIEAGAWRYVYLQVQDQHPDLRLESLEIDGRAWTVVPLPSVGGDNSAGG
jgi:hypothetical protein